jgi:hypothetical protein
MSLRRGSKPRRTDRLVVGLNVTLTLNLRRELGDRLAPQEPTIVGTGNGTPEVPELPSAWGYRWAALSPGVVNTERASSKLTALN